MQSFDQDVLFRDLLLFIAALIGLLYIIIINIKESRMRFRNFHKPEANQTNYDLSKLDWYGEFSNFYSLTFDEPHFIWEINMFSIKVIKKDKKFSSYSGFTWFEFSKSQANTEKIMSPILRKIFLKYRAKFEKVHPIHVLRVPKETVHFYTWLQNETHTNTAIFNFLDESLYIASEAKVYPSLSIIWDDIIYVEVVIPNNSLIKNVEKEFISTFGAECKNLGTNIHLRLWIAFSIEKIPNSLKEKEKQLANALEMNKAS